MESKVNRQNLGWGILLICFGISAMLDLYTGVSEWFKIGVFLVGGLVALGIFFTNRSNLLLLIPAYVMLAIALIGAVAILDLLDGDFVGTFVLVLVGAPFLFVYFTNRAHWWALIPSIILLGIALSLFFTSVLGLDDDIIGPIILYAIALPFLIIYFQNKEHWWALIPAYTMILIGTLIGLTEVFNVTDDIIGPLILFGIGIPFLVVYFRNKENWWALIPAYVMFVIGTMIGLTELLNVDDDFVAPFMMFAIAIPFFYVYYRNRESRWALIPGGIMAFIGAGFLLSEPVGRVIVPVALIAAGLWVLLGQRKKE